MSLASLWNVPSTREELDTWGFSHLAHHRDVNAQIYRLTGINIEQFPLDPIDPKNPGQWEYHHQDMHAAVNQVLGISGFDLTSIDWNKSTELAGWIQSNGTEHRQWADILGIG